MTKSLSHTKENWKIKRLPRRKMPVSTLPEEECICVCHLSPVGYIEYLDCVNCYTKHYSLSVQSKPTPFTSTFKGAYNQAIEDVLLLLEGK